MSISSALLRRIAARVLSIMRRCASASRALSRVRLMGAQSVLWISMAGKLSAMRAA
jgi:hypothetical protein